MPICCWKNPFLLVFEREKLKFLARILPEEKSSDGDERKRSENEDERKKNHLLADKIQSAKFPQVKMMIAILKIEPFSNYYFN
jgi:hypothetical protein